ncbi:MAG: hypothetical protein Q9216_003474 [Gyalolechia sp. 2 TL-2023]
MADLRRFHDSVKDLMPLILRSPSTYTVAVLKAGASQVDAETQASYFWHTCQPESTIGDIRQKYIGHRRPNRDNNIELRHRLSSQVVDDSVKVGELDVYGDHLIVLEARTTAGSLTQKPDLQTSCAQDQGTQQPPPPNIIELELARGSPSESPIAPLEKEDTPSARDTKRNTLLPPRTSPQLANAPELTRSNIRDGIHSLPDSEKPHASRESPVGAVEVQQGKSRTIQLQRLLETGNLEILETAVGVGMKFLERIQRSMLDKVANDLHAEQQLKQIDKLKKQAIRPKAIIGVVGNTGAGKSSVINAILDEERLIPTSCMRACTAVVTEIAYNDQDIPYRAQIEYIQPSEWEEELQVLFHDLVTSTGTLSSDYTKEDTDAGVAYAKIKAVYPNKTRDEITKSSVGQMVSDVSHLLGKAYDMEDTDAFRFYSRLQGFVDSKEKATVDKNGKQPAKEMELWPLIKVVKIYVKSAALSRGAVLVDLPGTHDSNAARAAVAESYMKQTTGLWIVTPINRAVDDRAAKFLLGESFKRQLKMDGTFDLVTFICSKTDDISVTEAQDSLGLGEQMKPLYAELDELDSKEKTFNQGLQDLKDLKSFHSEVLNEVDDDLEMWEALREDMEEGEEVSLPKLDTPKKRKVAEYISSRKKLCPSIGSGAIDDCESTTSASLHDQHADEYMQDGKRGESITTEQVLATIAELKATKKEVRQSKRDLEGSITKIREQQVETKEVQESIKMDITTACISGRNAYSKRAIAIDYANGIKELDQELASRENEAAFDPEEELRDYERVAHNLPVFCVSSRGYQKLKGRFLKDEPVLGFKDAAATEIPLLQDHCTKLTEAGRIASSRRFLKNQARLIENLAKWASSNIAQVEMTQEQKASAEQHLVTSMAKLKSSLEQVGTSIANELSRGLSNLIFDKYEVAIASATAHAAKTVQKWAMPINYAHPQLGGYHCVTYQAICRRDGVYSNKLGEHDWNQALGEPMIKMILPGWEKAFARKLPTKVLSFAPRAFTVVNDFHQEIEGRVRELGCGIAGIQTLRQQLSVYNDVFKETASLVNESINATQKDINREFIPVIKLHLRPTYRACAKEHGQGTFTRMKAIMDTQIGEKRFSVFQKSVERVRKRLLAMIKVQQLTLADKIDDVLMAIQRDYSRVLGCGCGEASGQEMLLESPQHVFRKEFMEILDESEEIFGNVARLAETGVVHDERAGNASDVKAENESLHKDCKDISRTVAATQMPDTAQDARIKGLL